MRSSGWVYKLFRFCRVCFNKIVSFFFEFDEGRNQDLLFLCFVIISWRGTLILLCWTYGQKLWWFCLNFRWCVVFLGNLNKIRWAQFKGRVFFGWSIKLFLVLHDQWPFALMAFLWHSRWIEEIWFWRCLVPLVAIAFILCWSIGRTLDAAFWF